MNAQNADEARAPKAGRATMARVLQWLGVAVLATCCVLLVRLTLLVSQVAKTLDDNSDELAQILSTTARVTKRIDEFEERMHTWQRSLFGDGTRHAVDNITALLDAKRDGVASDPRAPEEIQHLLNAVAGSGLTFRKKDKTYSALKMYLLLLGKRKVYGTTLASADDFVKRVAGRTITGKPYEVVLGDGSTEPLEEWMVRELEAYRGRH